MHPISAVRHNGQTAYIWGAERGGGGKSPLSNVLIKGGRRGCFRKSQNTSMKKSKKTKETKKNWFRNGNDKDFCFSKLNWTDSGGGVISKHQIPKIFAVIYKSDLLHAKLHEPDESTGALQRNFGGNVLQPWVFLSLVKRSQRSPESFWPAQGYRGQDR